MRLLLAIAFLGVFTLSNVRTAHADPLFIDGVVAVVDDVVIFRSDVKKRMQRLDSKLPTDAVEHRTAVDGLTKVMPRILADEVLIAKDAARLGIGATDAEIAKGMATVAAANKMDAKQLAAAVAKEGYSPTDYRDEMRRQILEQNWLLIRASRKVERAKLTDEKSVAEAFEKERELLLRELRAHAYVDLR